MIEHTPYRDASGRFMARPAAGAVRRAARTERAAEDLRDAVVVRKVGGYTAFGYRAARTATVMGRTATGGSGEYHAQYDRERLIHQSRQFYRDNAIYRGMMDRAVAYIAGRGFRLQATTADGQVNSTLERLWRQYWRRPEARGLVSGPRLERLLMREVLICGDTGVIKIGAGPYAGQVQLVEAEQITGSTAGRSAGDVGYDRGIYGTPTRFYVSSYGQGGRLGSDKAQGYKPDAEFLFLIDPERPSSARGVPPCQAAFAMLHRINDVCDSEAIAWQVLARLAFTINKPGAAEEMYDLARSDPNKSSDAAEGDLAKDRLVELDYALIMAGRPGEEIKPVERTIPGRNFSESLPMFLRLLGLPLGLPLEIVLLDWTKSNYSQSRAVLEQAFQTFLSWQDLIEDGAHRPVYEWQVRRWVATRQVPDLPDIANHAWIRPSFPWLDQLKETQAQAEKLNRGLTTHEAVCKSLGMEREDVVAIRQREVTDAIERAQAITEQTGTFVPWQIFAGMSPGSGDGNQMRPGTDRVVPAKDDEEDD